MLLWEEHMTDTLASDAEKKARTQTAVRFRRANGRASLASIQSTIESMMGLPAGSLIFIKPDGRKIRADAKVATLRKIWEE